MTRLVNIAAHCLVVLWLLPPVHAATILVPENAIWKYYNSSPPPPAEWNQLSFDDSHWPQGPARLGYGEGSEATTTEGILEFPHPVAAYFRTFFQVGDPSAASGLLARLLRDDGAVVYLNGVELLRDNLPPGPVNHETRAVHNINPPEENTFFPLYAPSGLLKSGLNLLAVEIHQTTPVSADLAFALELTSFSTSDPAQPPVVRAVTLRDQTSEPDPRAIVLPGSVSIERSGSTELALAVNLRYSGSALPGLDYQTLPDQVTIPAGQNSVTLFVTAKTDDLTEGRETAVISILAPPANNGMQYAVDSANRDGAVFIWDVPPEDAPVVSIIAAQPKTSEPSPTKRIVPGRFTLSRTGANHLPLIVHLEIRGSARPGLDYDSLPSTVIIPDGQSSVDLLVTALDDNVIEPPETVVVDLLESLNPPEDIRYLIDPNGDRAMVTIAGEVPALIEILPPQSGSPGHAPGSVRLQLTGPADQRVTLQNSADLVRWDDLTSFFLPEGQVIFDDPAPAEDGRYYRLMLP